MNVLHKKKTPFFFLIDFNCDKPELIPLTDILSDEISYVTPTQTNFNKLKTVDHKLSWERHPIKKEIYLNQFYAAQKALQHGDTYLLNLTCSTPITTNYTLRELFERGEGKYKLFFKNKFVHFSPEPFVQIKENKIFSYPMKGTIDASVENAAEKILSNDKELREQYTIVDLIRNDFSSIAKNVSVDNFRYLERIKTNKKDLLAVSSKISGEIREEFSTEIGSIFNALLPAGSICGAPKKRTVELIRQIESHQRNYYTGVWGIFDGESVDSCVIIRYLEQTKNGFEFKSGGGITALSDGATEYEEMINKVYVPIY